MQSLANQKKLNIFFEMKNKKTQPSNKSPNNNVPCDK
jgi:hypothetical protein